MDQLVNTRLHWILKRSYSKVHFGFQRVEEHLKESLVGRVFSDVASNYDLMNDAMSFGVHRCWKDKLVKTLDPGPDTIMLDVAGGTGDIAIRISDYINMKCTKLNVLNNSHIKVVDINQSMLQVGQERYKKRDKSAQSNISWEIGNAEHLDAIPDNSVDAYTIAFGIRNCTHIDKVLQEAFRVIRKGGRFLCLEFSHIQDFPLLKSIYDQYSFQAIPLIGKLLANNRSAYQYLVESIRNFPQQHEFAKMISSAGFQHVRWDNLSFGVVAIHSAIKPVYN